MITHIDIPNFGSFKNFKWEDSIKQNVESTRHFKRLNVLYGRNYSGKTTLSRIFSSLETGVLPSNYDAPRFTLYGDSGDVKNEYLTQADVTAKAYDVRVYNCDFVRDNLSFLISESDGGGIKSFAIVGAENKKIAQEIEYIDQKLGSSDQGIGLRYRLYITNNERARLKEKLEADRKKLEDSLRRYATEKIKNNSKYGLPNYNIKSIRQDIGVVKKASIKPLSSTDAETKDKLLKQEALPPIIKILPVTLKIHEINESAVELLSKAIKPTQAIQELLDEAVLQTWVKEGLSLHKDKRDTCAFCRQRLPDKIWDVLGAHFNQESSDLESSVDACLASINSESSAVPIDLPLTDDRFYPEEKAQFKAEKNAFLGFLAVYRQDLDALKAALNLRRNSLFRAFALPVLKHDSDSLQRSASAINALIEKSNNRTASLASDQDAARTDSRLSEVASFIDDNQYDSELESIAALNRAAEDAELAYTVLDDQIEGLERNRVSLEGRQQDETIGARAVNDLLTSYFGRDDIQLVVRDDSEKTAVKFEIMRGEQPAFNLSEGERSLIAFCYFMAKLKEAMRHSSDLIIYIDDPISSLDASHVFFVFSLIHDLITKPDKEENGLNSYRYKQLFISTHNLEFLKYLKRLHPPKMGGSRKEAASKKKAHDLEWFLVERNKSDSELILMPSYLRKYITEFQYLFHQIYKCRSDSVGEKEREVFYSFGNNLRKFLEVLLFFKYPHHKGENDNHKRIQKYFGTKEPNAVTLVERLVNEFSHLESGLDRGVVPVDVPEIAKVATFVLGRMKVNDPDQYESLLLSVGELSGTST